METVERDSILQPNSYKMVKKKVWAIKNPTGQITLEIPLFQVTC